MATSGSIDTNILLDWLLERDASRSRAIGRLFESSRELHIADLVIAEMVYVLQTQAKLTRATITDFVNRVINEEVFTCNRLMIRRALALYESEPKLSWVDCCAVFYAELNDALPLFTYDKDLIKKSGGRAKLPA